MLDVNPSQSSQQHFRSNSELHCESILQILRGRHSLVLLVSLTICFLLYNIIKQVNLIMYEILKYVDLSRNPKF